MKITNMYFLTEKDNQYSIKGSRDPLGFQVIWQNAGRKLIPNLSTVSNNITDFQILTLAYACKNYFKLKESQFAPFFIQLEQLMAYTRLNHNIKGAFNGVERAKKIFLNSTQELEIGVSKDQQILSNQRSYGIWGKYNRPYTSMGIKKDETLINIYIKKIEGNNSFKKLMKTFINRINGEISYVNKDKLKEFKEFILEPEKEETKILEKYLLRDNFQYELNKIFKNSSLDVNLESFYEVINYLKSESKNEDFNYILNVIENTELTISPLNRIFRFLQTKSYWTKKQINEDDYISRLKLKNIDNTFLDKTNSGLASLHLVSNFELVKFLQKRNEDISKSRNSEAWMNMQGENIEVNHFEGAIYDTSYESQKNNDNNYFFNSYLSLFKQLN